MAHLRQKIVLLLAMLAIPAMPIAARADNGAKAEAKKHFDRAMELNQDGQVAEAIVELKRCYEISPHHAVLYSLGQAYITLAKPVEAVAALQRFLDEGGKAIKADRRAEVEKEIARQKTRIATLEIRGLPDGAAVTIDGDEAGKVPLATPVRVGVGKHIVAATAAGYETGEAKIEVAGEDNKVVELKLVPRAGQPPAVAAVGAALAVALAPGSVLSRQLKEAGSADRRTAAQATEATQSPSQEVPTQAPGGIRLAGAGDASAATRVPDPESPKAVDAASASEHKVLLGLSFLPMALGRMSITDSDVNIPIHNLSRSLSYGVGLSLGYAVTPTLTIGLAPQAVFHINGNEVNPAYSHDSRDLPDRATSEYDLMVRIAYAFMVSPKLGIYLEALPGYAILDVSLYGKSVRNPSGFVIAGGAGVMMDVSDRLFVSLGIGYQWGAQWRSKGNITDFNGDFRTSFLRIALGTGIKL